MKTSTSKSLIVALGMMLLTSQLFAQDLVGTRIDVQGTRFGDQMWLFSVATCTTGFDNGWDGYKMYGSSPLIPQIYASEPTANFQIDAIPTFNNTYICFKAGEDTTYTMTFVHQLVETKYPELYLIDSVANTVVDIHVNGTKYTFAVQPTATAVKRFKVVTTNPNPTAVVPVEPVVIPPVEPVVVEPVVTPPVVVEPVIVPPVVVEPVVTPPVPPVVVVPVVTPDPVIVADKKDKKDKKDKHIKISQRKNVLVVENDGKQKGKVCLYNGTTGKKVKELNFNANGTTNLDHKLPKGTYVAKGATCDEEVSINILVQ